MGECDYFWPMRWDLFPWQRSISLPLWDLRLRQLFTPRNNVIPREHRSPWGCHNWRRVLLAPRGSRPGMPLSIPQHLTAPTTKSYSSIITISIVPRLRTLLSCFFLWALINANFPKVAAYQPGLTMRARRTELPVNTNNEAEISLCRWKPLRFGGFCYRSIACADWCTHLGIRGSTQRRLRTWVPHEFEI